MNEIQIYSYIKLGIAALLPALAAVIIYYVDKHYIKEKLSYTVKQIIIGVIFGGFAVIGTEWGIDIGTAVANARDGAVLIAGLLFGGPAGIIAGLIGGIERWFAVFWGVGSFTRVACTVSTILAGFFAAALRKYMFDDKRPSWVLALASGVVMETFHLTMVFVTNMDQVTTAMSVVKACTAPLILANSIAVMLAAIFIAAISHEKLSIEKRKEKTKISQSVQRWLFVSVFVAFIVTTFFMFRVQNELADRQADELITLSLEDLKTDIEIVSDRNMLSVAKDIVNDLDDTSLNRLAEKNSVSEINVVDKEGIIIESTNPDYYGFDMKSGEQSEEFMCLAEDTKTYAQGLKPITYDSSVEMKYVGIKTNDGYIQVGCDARRLQRDIAHEIANIAENRHVGQTGFLIVFNVSNIVVSVPKELVGTSFSQLSSGKTILGDVEDYQTVRLTYDGNEYLAQKNHAEGYTIVSMYPVTEAYQSRNIATYMNVYMEILVFGMMFAMIYFLIKLIVVRKIRSINGSLNEISAGNLDVVVDVRSNEEFASLSDDINQTVDTLKGYIDRAAKRFDEDLAIAKSIQHSVLPMNFGTVSKHRNFEIYATMDAAKEVGGDFYDFYLTEPHRLNFLIADVSGKGISGSLFMMRAKAELKKYTEEEYSVTDAFTKCNNVLCTGNDAGMFVTAWQGCMDLETGEITYVNAGHNAPIIVRNDGTVEYLKSKVNLVLAGVEDFPYTEQKLQLEKGDMIFLYTDGVPEAVDLDETLFGEDRLLNTVRKFKDFPVNEICQKIKEDLDVFVGEAEQFDDITMLALKYTGDSFNEKG